MFVHNLNPVIFSFGFLSIRYYSLAYLFGIIFAYFFLRNSFKKRPLRNFGLKELEDLVFFVALGLLIGGRVGYFLFYGLDTFFSDPFEIFRLWHGGMSFHGGFLGGLIAIVWYSKKNKINFFSLTDRIVLVVPIGLFLGRLANFINGELVGTVANNLPFCISYINQGIVGCRHPSQLYEAAKNLLIFGILLFLSKKKLKKGTLSWLFVFLYGLLRFLITFFREDPRFFGLSMGQYLSFMMVLVGSFMLIKAYLRKSSS